MAMVLDRCLISLERRVAWSAVSLQVFFVLGVCFDIHGSETLPALSMCSEMAMDQDRNSRSVATIRSFSFLDLPLREHVDTGS